MFAAAAVPLAVAIMAPHSGYAANDACVVACTYPAPVVLIVSLYPWVLGSLLLGQLAVPLLIAILLTEWLSLVHFLGGRFTPTAIQSILVSVMWLTAAYGIGLALRRIVGVWLKDRHELEQENIDHFAGILHSHIKAGLTAVERESPDAESMVAKLHDMQDVVGKLRLSLLLSKDRIPLAMICSERVRFFSDVVNIEETPRFGARTVSQRVGRLVDRMLGDLLSNAAKHGAETVWIRFSPKDRELVFEILDDGPGFDDHILDDQDRSLHRLRTAAVDLGGSLTMRSREPRGSHLVLTVHDAG
jgi:signal transduction histidine kinase